MTRSLSHSVLWWRSSTAATRVLSWSLGLGPSRRQKKKLGMCYVSI